MLFCLDRWLITAFGQYAIATIGHEEHTRRVLACRELIWDSASELLRRSMDVVLDAGFFLREHRMRYVALAAALGARTKIHFVETPLATIRARLGVRNAQLPLFNFRIEPELLQGFRALYEVPSEGAEVSVIRALSERDHQIER